MKFRFQQGCNNFYQNIINPEFRERQMKFAEQNLGEF